MTTPDPTPDPGTATAAELTTALQQGLVNPLRDRLAAIDAQQQTVQASLEAIAERQRLVLWVASLALLYAAVATLYGVLVYMRAG